MQKTLDDWLAEFQSICLGGYFVQGGAADRFRHMEQANVKLKTALRKLIDDAQGKPLPPAAPPVKAAGPTTPPAQQPAVARKV